MYVYMHMLNVCVNVCMYVCDVFTCIHTYIHTYIQYTKDSILISHEVRLPVSSLRALLSLAADGVDLVHEDDRRGGLAGHHEQLSHHAGPFTMRVLYVCMYVCVCMYVV